jgi:uridine phosphorylase
MAKQYHIKCEKGEIAKYVLLPGDPKRAEEIAEHFDECECMAKNREFWTYTGKIKGVEITTTSTGIGGPSTAIATEELARCGARVLIRVGTCGAYVNANIGDLAILKGAIRDDGTTREYVKKEFPAVSSLSVNLALASSCEKLGYLYFWGISNCTDALYAEDPFLDIPKEKKAKLGEIAEMESSALFVLSSLYGLRAGGICSVVNRVGDRAERFVYDKSNIEKLINAAIESVVILEEWSDKGRMDLSLRGGLV